MRERWRSTSPTSSSDAPLRSMSVARLWRSRCEPTYFCGGFRPVFLNASSSTVFMIWAFLNGRWCGVLAETNNAREWPDEPSQAELGIAAGAAGDPTQYRVPKALRGDAIEVTDPKRAFLDCL